MKIALIVSGGVDRGGVDRIVPAYLSLIERLARRHDVHVFALRQEHAPSEWNLRGARIHNVGTARGTARRLLSQFSSEHRVGAFDIIHAVIGWAGVYGSFVSLRHRVPLLFHASGGEFVARKDLYYGMRTSILGRIALRVATATARQVTVPSRYMQSLAASLGVRTCVLPVGVALDEWPPSAPRAHDPSLPVHLLHVGDLRPVKGQDTLLAAVCLLRDSGLSLELDMAGADTMDGTLQRSKTALRLGTTIRWHGQLRRPALRSLMDRADLLVVSSHHEADPMVMLEAAIAGVPTVGSSVGHIAEWAPDAAVAVPPGDPAALASAITVLMSDEPRRMAVARAAQRRALAMDADASAVAIDRVYSAMVVDFMPTGDPFTGTARLIRSTTLPVLGIPVTFESNSRYVTSLIRRAYGRGSPVAAAPTIPLPRLHVSLVVREGTEDALPHAHVDHACPDTTRIVVTTRGSVALSDPLSRQSTAHVTTSLVADSAHFRREMLDAITLGLVAHFDRHPVHAAAIVRDGRVVLLAGPSGTGKSTLAYLAHSAGITVLSDDHVWVQTDPLLRIWSEPATARLTLDALAHFPELNAAGRRVPAGPDGKVAVDLATTGSPAWRAAEAVAVCLLERGNRTALARESHESLATALASQLAPGFDRFPDRAGQVIRALTAGGGWRLTLSNDPGEALPCLREMLVTN